MIGITSPEMPTKGRYSNSHTLCCQTNRVPTDFALNQHLFVTGRIQCESGRTHLNAKENAGSNRDEDQAAVPEARQTVVRCIRGLTEIATHK